MDKFGGVLFTSVGSSEKAEEDALHEEISRLKKTTNIREGRETILRETGIEGNGKSELKLCQVILI